MCNPWPPHSLAIPMADSPEFFQCLILVQHSAATWNYMAELMDELLACNDDLKPPWLIEVTTVWSEPVKYTENLPLAQVLLIANLFYLCPPNSSNYLVFFQCLYWIKHISMSWLRKGILTTITQGQLPKSICTPTYLGITPFHTAIFNLLNLIAKLAYGFPVAMVGEWVKGQEWRWKSDMALITIPCWFICQHSLLAITLFVIQVIICLTLSRFFFYPQILLGVISIHHARRFHVECFSAFHCNKIHWKGTWKPF
jgi:hypothetical protein